MSKFKQFRKGFSEGFDISATEVVVGAVGLGVVSAVTYYKKRAGVSASSLEEPDEATGFKGMLQRQDKESSVSKSR